MGVMPDLPIPLLIGKDWPRFPVELPAPHRKNRCSRMVRRLKQSHPVARTILLPEGSEDSSDTTAGVESHSATNLIPPMALTL